MGNISRQARRQRPPKPEFSFIGLLIGAFVGEALAVVIEISRTEFSRLIMLAGGAIGLLLGVVFESARYWRQKQQREATRRW
jgi:hypothetical protein